jgi:hypothetical protein
MQQERQEAGASIGMRHAGLTLVWFRWIRLMNSGFRNLRLNLRPVRSQQEFIVDEFIYSTEYQLFITLFTVTLCFEEV